MRVLIVDDEALARDRLRSLLETLPDCEVVGEAAGGREALELAQRLQPDVVLLDIRMPGMDGLEAARHLGTLERPPAIVFATAYGDYALEAFDAQAVDYVLKPVRRERLERALAQARRLTQAQVAELEAAHGGAPRARTHICARLRGNLQLVPVAEVYYFQADQKYVTVRHRGGEVLIEESLKSLEREFGERFVRVHRNALVAAAYLAGMERTPEGRCYVRLKGIEDRIEVSRRHVPGLRRRLKALGMAGG